MRCPKCNSQSSVIDVRPSIGNSTRRRRKCHSCGERFSTREIIHEYAGKPKKKAVYIITREFIYDTVVVEGIEFDETKALKAAKRIMDQSKKKWTKEKLFICSGKERQAWRWTTKGLVVQVERWDVKDD